MVASWVLRKPEHFFFIDGISRYDSKHSSLLFGGGVIIYTLAVHTFGMRKIDTGVRPKATREVWAGFLRTHGSARASTTKNIKDRPTGQVGPVHEKNVYHAFRPSPIRSDPRDSQAVGLSPIWPVFQDHAPPDPARSMRGSDFQHPARLGPRDFQMYNPCAAQAVIFSDSQNRADL